MKHLLCLSCLLVLSLAACKRSGDGQPASKAPAAVASSAQKPRTATPASATPVIPSLQVDTIDGKRYDLAARRGRWVVVNFWATWCGPCLKEMPELSALDAMRENIEVIGLAYEDIKPEEMRAFLKKHPVVYPIAIVDVYAPPPSGFAAPRGLPTTYLVAPDGKIAKQFLGPVTAKAIEDAIAAAGGPKAG